MLTQLRRAVIHFALIWRTRGPISRFRLATSYAALVLRRLVQVRDQRGAKTVGVLGCRLTYFSLADLILLVEEILIRQVYEIGPINPGSSLVDCGSNIGISVLFFRIRYPDVRITAFEPDPETYALLAENVAANKWESVDLVNAAVGPEEGMIDFYIDPHVPGSLMMSGLKSRMNGSPREVACVTLSSQLRGKVGLLKLDIEGFEGAVLDELEKAGSLGLIDRMAIEYHHHIVANEDRLSRVLALLERNGFGYSLLAGNIYGRVNLGRSQDVMIFAYTKSTQASTSSS
jgi:FkbM family methyltransferase